MKIIVIFLILHLTSHVDSARILGIFPVPAPSHYILASALMKGLVEKGHDVTIVSPFNEQNPPKNGKFKEIVLTGLWELAEEERKNLRFFEQDNISSFILLPFMTTKMMEVTEYTLNHTYVQELIHSNETFDLVIVEQFMNDALKAFASHFKAPLLLFSSIGANSWVNLLVGNSAPTSYVPALFMTVSSKMTLYERTINTLMYVCSECLNRFYAYSGHRQLVKKYFPNDLDLYDVLYNASIVLLNSHPSTNQPVPTVPSLVDIGGFHVHPPRKLPQDLQKFLDNAKDGVVYFSLGTNLKSTELPPMKREAFLKSFAKLKQKVLWKWEDDVLPGQPPNVKLGKWLPQQDILAHPNVKLFITHGGLLSTTETIYHGVPVLAIPVFGDQKINAQNIVNSGFGLSLSFRDLTEELLIEKLNKLLTDPVYAENAKRRSKVFHDRQNAPMDTANYWVEYVIRHGGAPHLKVEAVDVPLYQYFLLDVILVLSVLVTTVVYVSYVIVTKLCRRKREKLKKN